MTNTCKHCDSPIDGNKKYCNSKCYRQAMKPMKICENCKKDFRASHKDVKCCSNICAANMRNYSKITEKVKATMLLRYGVDHVGKMDDFKQKVKKTKMERYGDENYVNSAKSKSTKLEKYGDENYNNLEKNKSTKLEKYGDENYNNREQFKTTMNTEYGGIGLQRDSVKKAAGDAFKKKYGVGYPFQSTEIRNKMTDSMIEKFGNKTYWGSDTQRQVLFHKMRDKLNVILPSVDLELISDFNGTKRIINGKMVRFEYEFKCKICNTQFQSRLSDGNVPSCPICHPVLYTKSHGQDELLEYVQSLLPQESILKDTRSIITPQELDIYIPSKKIAFEYNGLYWHSEIHGQKDKNYHLTKTKECEKLGIHLVHIFEDEWINKQDIIKSRIKNLLTESTQKIHARKCVIKEIDTQTKNKFLLETHLQGEDKSSIKLGAYYGDKLVSVMTFGKPRKSTGYNGGDFYELVRFSSNEKVVGIASKFISYFVKHYTPTKIISYADRRWTTTTKRSVYEACGFTKISETVPNYWYFDAGNVRLHRFNFRKDVLSGKLSTFDLTLTEWQNMQLNEYDRIWDCGSIKYELIP